MQIISYANQIGCSKLGLNWVQSNIHTGNLFCSLYTDFTPIVKLEAILLQTLIEASWIVNGVVVSLAFIFVYNNLKNDLILSKDL